MSGYLDIDDYISKQSLETQPLLMKIRETIRKAAPDAVEKISYQMPTIWQKENLVHFAVFKKHIGFYPGGEATGVFAKQLEEYQYSKGAIQFPYNKEIDYPIIYEITCRRIKKKKKKVIQ